MDPLSISAGIAGLLALTGSLVKYLSSVENASDTRDMLLMEVSSVSGLLFSLKDICQQVEPHSAVFISLQTLSLPQGPFELFKKSLELLTTKLTATRGRDRLKKAMTWHFEQSEVKDLMEVVQRQKTYYILALQGNHILLTQELSRSLADIEAEVRKIDEGIHSLKVEQKNQGLWQLRKHTSDLLTWLSPLTFEDRHKSILAQVQPGTGKWLLEHDRFMEWLAPRREIGILWLPGIPGSGKTSLAALVIEHVEKTFDLPEVGVVYLYCDYKDTGQTFERLQRSILRQLLQRVEIIPPEINEIYDRYLGRYTEPEPSEVHDLLLLVASKFSHVFFVIDALDELSGIEGATDLLLKLCKDLGSYCSTLITSRWTGDLDHHILQASTIDILARDDDIRLYLEHELQKRGRIQRLAQKDPAFEIEVVDTILQHCKGMFLVARLHIESLATKSNLRAAKLALRQLPSTLDGMYGSAIDRINMQTQEDVELAWKVISWIVRSTGPLTAVQLQHALAVDPECDFLDHDAFIDLDLILAVCVGLVVLDANSSTLRLVHFTTQEYFDRHAPEMLPRAGCEIARVCIQYLSFEKTAYFSKTDEDLSTKLESFPLFEYAAKHWGDHVATCCHSDCHLDGSVNLFFGDLERVAGLVQGMLLPLHMYRGFSQDMVENVSPLHLAAHFGLSRNLEVLLKTQSPASRDTAGRTPLHWAARKGHVRIAKMLLENGSEIDALDNVQATSLHLACRYSHLQLASLLVVNGSNVNAANNVGGTALIWAAIAGSIDIARFLLDHGADIDAMTDQKMSSIAWAADANNEAMVQLLLERGADLNNYVTNARRSPLHIATTMQNESIMRVLLEAGATPQMQTSELDISKTTIGSAIMAKSDGPLRLLLEYGIDPNARGMHGETPIHYAARLGNLAIFSTLVQAGCRVEAVDEKWNTVLHAAVNEQNEKNEGDMVRHLIGMQCINIHALGSQGYTALEQARLWRLEKITRLLLDAEAMI